MPRTETELREQLRNIDQAIVAATNLLLEPDVHTEVAAALADFQARRATVVAELYGHGAAETDLVRHLAPGGRDAGDPAVFGPEARDGVTAWQRARDPKAFDQAQDLSFGRYLRGICTGEWDGREMRFLAEANTGTNIVPTPLAASIIDKARNATRVVQAGARTVPMDSQTLKMARITGDPTASWRAENAAIVESDATLDVVTFTARSLAFYTKVSRELVEDAEPSVDSVLRNQFAAVIALELDRVALRGTGTAPEPRGVLNTSGITALAHGTNGSTIGSPPSATVVGWEFLVDAAGAVRSANFEPTAQIMAPRTDQSLAKLRDTSNQYIAPPAYLAGLPRLSTKQVPINLTVGTSTDTSEVYTGQWDNLMIGMRTSLQLQLLDQAFMISAGQYALVAWLRMDVQLAQPAAFAVDTGVRS
jgi:HK97 family phage major capsid protein